MNQSIANDPKMQDPKDPHKNAPEQFPPRQGDPNQPSQKDRDTDQPFAGKEYGEGNYKAAKEYDDATRDFVRSGRVEGAAKEAEPRTGQEARDLAAAEAQGRMRSKGEDASSQPTSKKRKQNSKR